ERVHEAVRAIGSLLLVRHERTIARGRKLDDDRSRVLIIGRHGHSATRASGKRRLMARRTWNAAVEDAQSCSTRRMYCRIVATRNRRPLPTRIFASVVTSIIPPLHMRHGSGKESARAGASQERPRQFTHGQDIGT